MCICLTDKGDGFSPSHEIYVAPLHSQGRVLSLAGGIDTMLTKLGSSFPGGNFLGFLFLEGEGSEINNA